MRHARSALVSAGLTVVLAATLVARPADAAKKRRAPAPAPPAPVTVAISPDLEAQIWSVLESGTRTGDIPARSAAVFAITALRPSESRAYAVDALKDPQWPVRAGAIRALVRLGDAAYETPLQEALARGTGDVARDVLPLFEAIPGQKGVDLLLRVLASPSVPDRERLVGALVARGGAFATAVFRAALVGPSSADPLLAKAVAGLGEDALPLLAVAAESRDPQVLANLFTAVGNLPKCVPVDFLVPLLTAPNAPTARVPAAMVLAARGHEAGAKVLTEFVARGLGDEPDPAQIAAYAQALTALAGAPTPAALEAALAVLDMAYGKNPALLDAVFGLFAAAGDSRVLPRLQAVLNDTVADLRAVAVRHLGRVHGPRSLANLYPLLVDGYPQVRLGAALAIGDLGQSESIPRLQAALNDSLIDVRRAVVQALSRIRDKAVVDVVAFLVSDPDDAIRASAMEALVQVHHSSALPSLRIGLSDRKEAIRFIAFRGMMKIAPDAAVEEWPRLLNWLSAAQMAALVREFGKPMLPLIERALGHSRAPVRQAALAATVAFDKIDRLGLLANLVRSTEFGDVRLQALRMVIDEQGAAAVALLLDLARDPDLAVRRAAVEALGAAGRAAALAGDVAATDVIAALQAALMDGDEGVRIGAAASILQVAGR